MEDKNKTDKTRKRARKLFKELRPSIHHIDHNPLNNNINNLISLTRKEHRYIHIKQGGTIKIKRKPKIKLSQKLFWI